MVNQPLIIYAIATTKDIIAVLYYNSAPLVEVDRVKKAVGDDNSNYVFANVNAGAATVRYYESDDGEELTTLLGTFQLNISEKKAVLEERFWYVGRNRTDDDGNVYDPVPGEFSFTDNYLDGKILTSLNKRGSGPTQEGVEWSRSGNTISTLNPENQSTIDGPVFAENDVWVGMISYLQEIVPQAPQLKVFYDEITEDTILTSGHRNKWLYLNGSSTRLKLTAEALSAIGDGDWYGFVTNGGNQYQTTFEVGDEGDAININGQDKMEIHFGNYERWQIFKRGSKFDVLHGLEYLSNIGQFVKSYKGTEINTLPCDGIKRSGLDYPRAKEYILELDSNTAINSSTVGIQDIGCWHYWEEGGEWFFRTPNKQNMYGRNLKSFSSRGTDTERLYDYGGGLQTESVGKHRHLTMVSSGEPRSSFPPLMTWLKTIRQWWYKSGGGAEGYHLDVSDSEPNAGRTSEGHREGSSGQVNNTENRTTNVGEFEFVRI